MNTHISTLDLNEIAKQINSEHEKLIAQVKRTAAHFIRLGELLTQAKGTMNHGEWTPWLLKNCSVGPEQARRYMRLYAKRDEIDQTGLEARFSIEKTLKALSADPEPEEIILEGEIASAESGEPEAEATESERTPENGLEACFEESESKSEEIVAQEPEAETEEPDSASDVTPE